MAEILWIVGIAAAAVVAWLLGRGSARKRYGEILQRAANAARESDSDGVRRAGAGISLPGLREVKEVLLREAGSAPSVPAASDSSVRAPSDGPGEREAFTRRSLDRFSTYLKEGVEEPLRSGLEGDDGGLRGSVQDALVAVEDLYFYLRDVPESRSREDLNELARIA
ncbi:MAG: hypothetical protein GWM92_05625, partial [Gemmatimonadetes bacterium]|nr:hypothetical protein [Gemmatimonadota bacterium]NIR79337.1 hypothetical protein [Gemmatimonadota bacterium]NIT86625.1 hypothetical protein [Gemmatimonadota bacterium]NIU30472.1 hypothetical protein [Gemmatimonadota bacterium]NIU35331.1 hypothetical protein [Gemmatimonadota bacterium]